MRHARVFCVVCFIYAGVCCSAGSREVLGHNVSRKWSETRGTRMITDQHKLLEAYFYLKRSKVKVTRGNFSKAISASSVSAYRLDSSISEHSKRLRSVTENLRSKHQSIFESDYWVPRNSKHYTGTKQYTGTYTDKVFRKLMKLSNTIVSLLLCDTKYKSHDKK